jgi:hypothetical protein
MFFFKVGLSALFSVLKFRGVHWGDSPSPSPAYLVFSLSERHMSSDYQVFFVQPSTVFPNFQCSGLSFCPVYILVDIF